MQLGTQLVFDQHVTGTSGAWYSTAELNQFLGSGNSFAVQAVVTGVSGTSPALQIVSEHSFDGEHWIATGSTEINQNPIVNNSNYTGSLLLGTTTAGNVRLKITLPSGTNPSCRLKVYVTVRSAGGG